MFLNYQFCEVNKNLKEVKSKKAKKNWKENIENSEVFTTYRLSNDSIVKFAMLLSIEVEQKYNTNAIVQTAQFIVESNCGKATIARRGNNFFGIKCHMKKSSSPHWKGSKIFADDDKLNECFRMYNNMEQSFLDYGYFLSVNDRYKKCLNNSNYKVVIQELKKAGYATSSIYVSTILTTIKTFDLQNLYINTKKITNERIDSNSLASNHNLIFSERNDTMVNSEF